jgi:hypothetical protein
LWYCVKEEDIEMAIRDSQDDWRVLVLNQEMSMDKEDDVGKEHTPVGDKMMPKNPNLGHKPTQQKKGGETKKCTQAGKKDNTQAS